MSEGFCTALVQNQYHFYEIWEGRGRVFIYLIKLLTLIPNISCTQGKILNPYFYIFLCAVSKLTTTYTCHLNSIFFMKFVDNIENDVLYNISKFHTLIPNYESTLIKLLIIYQSRNKIFNSLHISFGHLHNIHFC